MFHIFIALGLSLLVITKFIHDKNDLMNNLKALYASLKCLGFALGMIVCVMAVAGLIEVIFPQTANNPLLWVASKALNYEHLMEFNNALLIGLFTKWPYGLILAPVLLLTMPSISMYAETFFREGTQNWLEGIWRSIVFGLAHLILLIPLSFAIGLIIHGLWLTHHYLKGGTMASHIYQTCCGIWLMGAAIFSALLNTAWL